MAPFSVDGFLPLLIGEHCGSLTLCPRPLLGGSHSSLLLLIGTSDQVRALQLCLLIRSQDFLATVLVRKAFCFFALCLCSLLGGCHYRLVLLVGETRCTRFSKGCCSLGTGG